MQNRKNKSNDICESFNNSVISIDGTDCSNLKEFPKDWKIIPIAEIFQESCLKYSKFQHENPNIPILSMTRYDGLVLQSEKFGKRVASKNLSNYKVVQKGEFVVGFPIDEGVIFSLKNFSCGVVSPVYTIWKKINESVDSDFLDYFLKTPMMIEKYKQVMVHAVERRRYIKKEDFLALQIPLPPLPEQQAIAATLRTVQAAKEKNDAVIAATKALKSAMMKHLFMYGPVPLKDTEKIMLKETDIGQVPEGWDFVKLEDVVRQKITDGVHITPKYSDDGVPFISATNMVNDTLNFTNCKRISFEDNKKLNQRCNPEFDDILLCKVGSIGKVAKIEVTFPFSIFVQVALIKPDFSKINSEFLKYSLISEIGQSQILTNSSQSTMIFIGTNKIGKLLIPYPELSIQVKIGKILAIIDQKLAAEQSRKEALDALFMSLLHDLMTAKIRVKPV